MTPVLLILLILLVLIVYSLVVFPVSIVILARLVGGRQRPEQVQDLPSVSLLCVVHNGEKMIAEKIANSLDLDYPRDKLEVVVASDGSTDATVEIVRGLQDAGVKLVECVDHDGKIPAINRAVPECRGEIVLFTDTDAHLDRQALRQMVPWFADAGIGGVCGRKVVRPQRKEFQEGQTMFVSYEDQVRLAESDLSSIASNEGKIYAIRKALFRPMPPPVTDDLFNCLNVILQHHRFVFEPAAIAWIPTPSRDPAHEVERRRRIVGCGLYGLWLVPPIFNPLKYGLYPWMLFSHKVMRRLVSLFLFLFFIFTGIGAFHSKALLALFALQVLGLCGAFVVSLVGLDRFALRGPLRRIVAGGSYFLIGNLGMLLGIFDFVRGKRITKWSPKKGAAKVGSLEKGNG